MTDAERVATRQDLVFNDAKLCTKLLRPGRPPTFVTDGDSTYLTDSFLFVDLPRRVDTDKLQQFAEKAAHTCVDKIVFSCTNPSSALIKYSQAAGINAVFTFIQYYAKTADLI